MTPHELFGKRIILTSSAIVLTLFLIGSAAAQDVDTWQYDVTVYGFYSGIDADIKLPNGVGSGDDLTINASNIIEDLNMIFMGAFEARNDKWALLADVIYMDLSDEMNRTLPAPDSGLPVNRSVDLGMSSWIVSGATSYEVVKNTHGSLGIVGGARYIWVDVDVKLGLKGPFGLIDPAKTVSDSGSYFDGIVGLRGTIDLGEHWYLPYYADIGTGQSDLTWQAFAGIGYRFGWGDVRLAYRYMYYDFGDDKVMQNLTLNGPILGVSFRF